MTVDLKETVLSTVTLVLDEFLNHVETNLPGVNFIYDENLTVETAIRRMREKATAENIMDFPLFPLFTFKRTVLRHSADGQGRRSVTNRMVPDVKPDAGFSMFNAVHAEFDIMFAYYSNVITDEENFEISYLSENGLSARKEISVEVPDVGIFPYMLQYNPLTDKTFNVNDIYYKVTTGAVLCRGWYFSLKGAGKAIKSIEKRIMEFNSKYLEGEIITP